MGLRTTLKDILGSAWHVAHDAFFAELIPETDGTVEASKPVVADANKDVTGIRNLTVTGAIDASAGAVNVPQSVADVTEAAPTDAELDAAFGTPATLGRGFIGTVDDNDGSTASVLVWTTDSAWFHVVGTLSS